MIVYKDMISGDEVLSDAFSLKEVLDKEGNPVDGLMMIESKMISKSDDVDVGCGDAFGGGDADGPADTSMMVNNVIDSFQLTETQIGSPADFKAWIKEYMNAIRGQMKEKGLGKEKIQEFMGKAQGIAKFLLQNFSDLQFYLGPAFNPDTMIFSLYPDGAVVPNFYYIMDGLVAEKF